MASSADVLAAAVAVLVAAVLVVGSLYGLRHAFAYSLENSILEIKIFGITVQRVPLVDIDQVEVIPYAVLVPFNRSFRWDTLFALKWSGYNKKVVAIKRRKGLVKRIVLSPKDPDAFANSLRSVLASANRG